MLGDEAIEKRGGAASLSFNGTLPAPVLPVPPLSDETGPRPWWRRRSIPVVLLTLLLHLALIALFVYFARVPKPLTLTAIPVTLVPPRPKPPVPLHKPAAHKPPVKLKPVQKHEAARPPEPKKPPPRGPLASVETGNPTAPRNVHTLAETPPAGKPTPKPGSIQPKTIGNATPTAATHPPKPAVIGEKTPQPKPVDHPQPKTGGSRARAVPGPQRVGGHHAKVPGPDATKDAYLAYLQTLVMANKALLSPDQIGSRTGNGVLEIVVRRNGTIVWITVLQSSGWPDIDERAKEMVSEVGSFPPLPRYFEGPSVKLTFTFEFPVSGNGP